MDKIIIFVMEGPKIKEICYVKNSEMGSNFEAVQLMKKRLVIKRS